MTRVLSVLLLALMWLPCAQAADVVADVNARLARADVLRGHFTQEKQIEGFSKPLRSEGDFVVARGGGVLWRTLRPFPSELALTRDAIRATQGEAVAFRLDADSEPAVRIINGLLFALLEGDVAALQRQFDVDGEATAERWSLRLRPRQATLAKLLVSIELRGNRHVDAIVIAEGNGDRTTIRLDDQRSEPPTLSDDERQRLH